MIKLSNYFDVDISELDEDLYNITLTNKKNAIAVVNSPHCEINSTEAILKISDALEKLTKILEKLLQK